MNCEGPPDNVNHAFKIIFLLYYIAYSQESCLTMSVPPPELICLKHRPSAGHTLVFPFIFQFQLHKLLLCQPLHVGRQCDAVVCQLWDLCGFINEQATHPVVQA